MSHYDYMKSRELDSDFSFASLIMGAMRKADSINFEKLKNVFPEIANELQARYNASGGYLEGEDK